MLSWGGLQLSVVAIEGVRLSRVRLSVVGVRGMRLSAAGSLAFLNY